VLFRPGDPAALAAAVELADKNGKLFEEYGGQARKTYEQRFDPDDSLRRLLHIYQYAIDNPI
jgi:glycosyltransferase involved in cell wall biosynthesis